MSEIAFWGGVVRWGGMRIADCGLRIAGKRGLGSGVLTPAIATFLIAMVRIYNVLSRKLNFRENDRELEFWKLENCSFTES
jgi:hypothetical protein